MFINYYEEYINYISLREKPTTILNKKRIFALYILPYFRNEYVKNIDSKKYIDWLLIIKNKNFSKSYNSQIYACIKTFYDFMYKFYNLENIAYKIGFFKNHGVNKEKNRTTWTIKEYNIFIGKVDNVIYHALFNCLFFTGIRRGEALALKIKDLNNNTLNINKSITKDSFDGKRLIQTTKTESSNRTVDIDSKLNKELEELILYYKKYYKNYNNDFFLFGGDKPIATTTLDRYKNHYCDLASIKRITIHEFRHSHATILYDSGVKVKLIQERLGHSNVQITLNTYIHDTDKAKKKLINMINFLRA